MLICIHFFSYFIVLATIASPVYIGGVLYMRTCEPAPLLKFILKFIVSKTIV